MDKILKEQYTERIIKALNIIRPYLQVDGGDVEFVSLTQELVVFVRLTGNCNNCKMKLQTLKLGIEQTIKKSVPEIVEVKKID